MEGILEGLLYVQGDNGLTLKEIMSILSLSEEDTKNIVSAVKAQKELIENVLQNNIYEDEIHEISKEDKKIVVYRKQDGSYDSLETYIEDDTCAY